MLLAEAEDRDLAGILSWQRPKQQGINQAENGDVGADAQRQREHGYRGESEVLAKHSGSKANILPQRSQNRLLTQSRHTPIPSARLRRFRYLRKVNLAQLVGSDAGFLGFFYDAAVEEVNGALGEVGVALVVRDHADGRAVAMQVAQQFHHGFAVLGVQVSGGLVSHQDERIADQRTRHSDTLLLTSRKLRRIVTQPMCHADAFERALHFLLALAGASAAISQRQLHVFVHSEVADQVAGLKDESNLALENARTLADGAFSDERTFQSITAFST